MIGRELSGKTLGLIGFGRIAQATAARAHHGFGMRIAYSAPRRQPAEWVRAFERLVWQGEGSAE